MSANISVCRYLKCNIIHTWLLYVDIFCQINWHQKIGLMLTFSRDSVPSFLQSFNFKDQGPQETHPLIKVIIASEGNNLDFNLFLSKTPRTSIQWFLCIHIFSVDERQSLEYGFDCSTEYAPKQLDRSFEAKV